MYTGSCLCGAVRFRIEGELAPIQVCYCGQCRKAQGTPFAANIPVSATAFKLTSGEEVLRAFESSPGKKRVFCGNCGSPVFSHRESLPGVLRLRAGLIDESLRVGIAAQIHTASKCNWWPLRGGVPEFPQAYTGPYIG